MAYKKSIFEDVNINNKMFLCYFMGMNITEKNTLPFNTNFFFKYRNLHTLMKSQRKHRLDLNEYPEQFFTLWILTGFFLQEEEMILKQVLNHLYRKMGTVSRFD